METETKKKAVTKKKEKKPIDFLNPKQRQFVLNYIETRIATTSYLDAYGGTDYDSASVKASTLLRNVKVKAAVDEMLNGIWAKKEDQISRVFDNILSMANAKMADYVEYKDNKLYIKDLNKVDSRAIKKLKVKTITENELPVDITEIELYDRKAANDLLTEILNMKKLSVDLGLNSELPISINITPVKPSGDE